MHYDTQYALPCAQADRCNGVQAGELAGQRNCASASPSKRMERREARGSDLHRAASPAPSLPPGCQARGPPLDVVLRPLSPPPPCCRAPRTARPSSSILPGPCSAPHGPAHPSAMWHPGAMRSPAIWMLDAMWPPGAIWPAGAVWLPGARRPPPAHPARAAPACESARAQTPAMPAPMVCLPRSLGICVEIRV